MQQTEQLQGKGTKGVLLVRRVPGHVLTQAQEQGLSQSCDVHSSSNEQQLTYRTGGDYLQMSLPTLNV